MNILTAFVNVMKSIFVFFKIVATETYRAITGFYRNHPVIAAYLTGAIAVVVVAIVSYNYGANGGKNPFASLTSSAETTTTAQSDTIQSETKTTDPVEPLAKPLDSTDDAQITQEDNDVNTTPDEATPLADSGDVKSNENSETPIQQPDASAKSEAKSLKGIDISQHNSSSTWSGKLDEIDFVIVKLSEGYTYTDPNAHEFLKIAADANKLIGAYHLVRPDSGIDAATEANFFVEQLKEAGWNRNWLLACDFEPQYSIKKNGAIDYKANADFCKQFLDEVTRLTDGVRPLMYACSKDINNGGDSWKATAESYGLWMAGYPQTNTTDSGTFLDSQEEMPYEIGPWKYLTIWQYSSAKHLDKDVAYMSSQAWSKFANPTVS